MRVLQYDQAHDVGHETDIVAGFHDAFDSEKQIAYDIDNPIDVIHANMQRLKGRPNRPRMGYDKWSRLTFEEKSA